MKYSASFSHKQYILTDPLFTYRLPQGFAEVTDNALDTGTGATGTGRVGLNINLKYRNCAYVRVHASRSNQSFTARILIHTVVVVVVVVMVMMMMMMITIIIKKNRRHSPINSHGISSALNHTVHPKFSIPTQTSQLSRLSNSETVI